MSNEAECDASGGMQAADIRAYGTADAKSVVHVSAGGSSTTLIRCSFAGPATGDAALAIVADISKTAPPEMRDDEAGPYSFEYSGRHDSGPLPPVSENYYSHLVAAIREAKAKTDALITAAMPAAASAAGAGSGIGAVVSELPPQKRSRAGVE